MTNFAEPIEKLINCFKKLPGVGAKTAQRYAFSVINGAKSEAEYFAKSLIEVKDKVHFCSTCGNYTDGELCEICKTRKSNIICVVKEPKDIIALEKAKNTNFVYHVLHGTLSPLENRGPDDIRIKELLKRIQNGDVSEIIMATNPDVEGDATAMYIARLIAPFGIKVTRLAQGISMGSDLEYADEVTLSRAIEKRQTI